MSRIVILHFSPLELYPPVQNLLHTLENGNSEKNIIILTTKTTQKSLHAINTVAENILIKRLGTSGKEIFFLKRYFTYLYYHIYSLLFLIWNKPESILYFETISSLPVYLYKKYFSFRVKVAVHYHEYTSPSEYETGMKLNKYFHKCEKKLFADVCWLSHTNNFRLKQFLTDIKPIKPGNPMVLPNYPPQSWPCKNRVYVNKPVKVVYVGALSLDTMFVKSFIEYVITQNGNLLFYIYAYNIDAHTKNYIEAKNSSFIKLMPGVNYDDLPQQLKLYDVGVVLYKGHIDNYVYNAPNKLFEYYASGLDVWFPDIMKGSLQYVTKNCYPKITALNFEKLNDLNLQHLIDHSGLPHVQQLFCCENALAPLILNLTAND
jgi:hypothetical protein